MAERTSIAWTDHTFNPVWGCTPVSEGCQHCYARAQAERTGHNVWGADQGRRIFGEQHWREPLRWNERAARDGVRRRVFCGSMCDVFENHPDTEAARLRLWNLIDSTPALDWLLLTKRPEIMRVPHRRPVRPNVWLGTSVELAKYAQRVRDLITNPAVVHFVSFEPALGSLQTVPLGDVEWVIYGGESGAGFRKHNPMWAVELRDRCRDIGIPFFYKQGSGYRQGTDPQLQGEEIRQVPCPAGATPATPRRSTPANLFS